MDYTEYHNECREKCEYHDEIETFFQEVMGDLGYRGWSIRWQKSDAYCWREQKIIDICPMGFIDECKQMLLHEIAHIDVVVHGNQHVPQFWQHLVSLTAKYLNSDLSEYQRAMMADYCPEIASTDLYKVRRGEARRGAV
jgi:hypothetical protein